MHTPLLIPRSNLCRIVAVYVQLVLCSAVHDTGIFNAATLDDQDYRQVFAQPRSKAEAPAHRVFYPTFREPTSDRAELTLFFDGALNHTLTLQPSTKDLMSTSLLTVTRNGSHGAMAFDHQPQHCHYQHVSPDIKAAISTCNNVLYGTVIHNGSLYVLAPTPSRYWQGDDIAARPHVIHRRSADHDVGAFCGYDASLTVSSNDDNVPTSRYSKSTSVTVELGIFIDQALYDLYRNKHGSSADSQLRDFVATAFNNIQILYNHQTLEPGVTFKITRYEVFQSQPSRLGYSAISNGDAQAYLDAFCQYQKGMTKSWDHSFLFTGQDIHKYGDRSISGIAKLSGMCTDWGSCTVAEGMDFTAVFIGAHEIGHSLGMSHDEPGCSSQFIMSASLGPGKTTWSTCSYNAFNRFLNKLDRYNNNCLRSSAGYESVHIDSGQLPGRVFDAKRQCEVMHGSGYEHVENNGNQICTMMWCRQKPNGHTITSHPALEGTSCGSGMHCLGGRCVSSGDLPDSTRRTRPQQNTAPAVNGAWSSWSSTTCSYCRCPTLVSGISLLPSKRSCSNPAPSNGGSECGEDSVRGIICSASCGKPTQSIQHYMDGICFNHRNREGDYDLTGKGTQFANGDRQKACKVMCNVETRYKEKSHRFFGDYLPDGTPCNSNYGFCADGQCLTIACSRHAVIASSAHCPKSSEECDDLPYNYDATWNDWAAWSKCTRTCGSGTQIRYRTCSSSGCDGENSESRDCSEQACPRAGERTLGSWQTWGSWSGCSRTCNGGLQYRYRSCWGSGCPGDMSESRECNTEDCEGTRKTSKNQNGEYEWTEWSRWSSCSKYCDTGHRSRTRYCQAPGSCPGGASDRETCNTQPCYRDAPNSVDNAAWASWNSWTACTVTCGEGTKRRYRYCDYSRGGTACPNEGREDTRACYEPACASWTDWSRWSQCSRTCGGGENMRTRSCDGGYCPGRKQDYQSCNTQRCYNSRVLYDEASSAGWNAWGQWSRCSKTCSGGSRTRRRSCGGSSCDGNKEEVEECGATPCAEWGGWGSWGGCSAYCGGGTKQRIRNCYGGSYGDDCIGSASEFESCNETQC